MGFPYYDLVVKAHGDLIHEGLIKQRTNQEEVEQDKGLLTRRAGYYVYSEKDETIGLLGKTEGNNSLGYSVDLLIQKSTGYFWDVATDNAGMATPVNGGPSGPDPELAMKWAEPTAELAQVGIEDGEYFGGEYEDDKAVQFGNMCNETYAQAKASPDAGMIGVHAMRTQFDYQEGMEWNECLLKHTNEFRKEYGLPPV